MAKPTMSQEQFEQTVRAALDSRHALTDTINAMTVLEYVRGDVRIPRVEMVHPVTAWDCNPLGNMHGGMITTLFDSSMGTLCKAYTGAQSTPTISLNVNFLRAVQRGTELHFQTELLHCGRNVLQLTALCWTDDLQRPAATAMGSFFRIERRG